MGNKGWFIDSGIIAQGSTDQCFEGIHYFQPMRLHKQALGAIFQTNVESIIENFENSGTIVKSPSPVLVEEILKLEAFKDIK